MKMNITILISVLLFIQEIQAEAQVSRPDYQSIILQEINDARKASGMPPLKKVPRYQKEADDAVMTMFLDWLWLDELNDEDYERIHKSIGFSTEAISGNRLFSSILLYGWDEADFMVDIQDFFSGPEPTVISHDVGFAAISVIEDEETEEFYGVVLTYDAINPSIPRPELSDVVIKEIITARSKMGIHPVGEIKRYREQSDAAVQILYREFSLIDSINDDEYIKVHGILDQVVKHKSGSKHHSQTILYASDRKDFIPMLRQYLQDGGAMVLDTEGRFIAASVLEDSVTGELYVAIMLYE
jgi:hypothetical protein